MAARAAMTSSEYPPTARKSDLNCDFAHLPSRRSCSGASSGSSYLEAMGHGMPPHGGFAIGLERWISRLLEADNIRYATLFPRDTHRIRPSQAVAQEKWFGSMLPTSTRTEPMLGASSLDRRGFRQADPQALISRGADLPEQRSGRLTPKWSALGP